MKSTISPSQKKYFYWLDPADYGEKLARLKKDKKRVHKAKQQPCEALYFRRDIVLVKPSVWDLRCKRQGSWYRASKWNGHYLVTASEPIAEYKLQGVISLESFSPAQLASDDDVVEMMSDSRHYGIIPDGWGEFSPWEVSVLQGYLKNEGVERSLEQMYMYYTANHLNFIQPKFFVPGENSRKIPYSIQKTTLVCSACIELFGIIGESFRTKFLCPCPGLKYVQAPKGYYLRVDLEV